MPNEMLHHCSNPACKIEFLKAINIDGKRPIKDMAEWVDLHDTLAAEEKQAPHQEAVFNQLHDFFESVYKEQVAFKNSHLEINRFPLKNVINLLAVTVNYTNFIADDAGQVEKNKKSVIKAYRIMIDFFKPLIQDDEVSANLFRNSSEIIINKNFIEVKDALNNLYENIINSSANEKLGKAWDEVSAENQNDMVLSLYNKWKTIDPERKVIGLGKAGHYIFSRRFFRKIESFEELKNNQEFKEGDEKEFLGFNSWGAFDIQHLGRFYNRFESNLSKVKLEDEDTVNLGELWNKWRRRKGAYCYFVGKGDNTQFIVNSNAIKLDYHGNLNLTKSLVTKDFYHSYAEAQSLSKEVEGFFEKFRSSLLENFQEVNLNSDAKSEGEQFDNLKISLQNKITDYFQTYQTVLNNISEAKLEKKKSNFLREAQLVGQSNFNIERMQNHLDQIKIDTLKEVEALEKNTVHKIAEFENTIAQLNQAISEQEKEKEKYADNELNTENQLIDDLTKDIGANEIKVNALISEISELQNILDDLRKTGEEISGEVGGYSTQIEKNQNELNQIKNQLSANNIFFPGSIYNRPLDVPTKRIQRKSVLGFMGAVILTGAAVVGGLIAGGVIALAWPIWAGITIAVVAGLGALALGRFSAKNLYKNTELGGLKEPLLAESQSVSEKNIVSDEKNSELFNLESKASQLEKENLELSALLERRKTQLRDIQSTLVKEQLKLENLQQHCNFATENLNQARVELQKRQANKEEIQNKITDIGLHLESLKSEHFKITNQITIQKAMQFALAAIKNNIFGIQPELHPVKTPIVQQLKIDKVPDKLNSNGFFPPPPPGPPPAIARPVPSVLVKTKGEQKEHLKESIGPRDQMMAELKKRLGQSENLESQLKVTKPNVGRLKIESDGAPDLLSQLKKATAKKFVEPENISSNNLEAKNDSLPQSIAKPKLIPVINLSKGPPPAPPVFLQPSISIAPKKLVQNVVKIEEKKPSTEIGVTDELQDRFKNMSGGSTQSFLKKTVIQPKDEKIEPQNDSVTKILGRRKFLEEDPQQVQSSSDSDDEFGNNSFIIQEPSTHHQKQVDMGSILAAMKIPTISILSTSKQNDEDTWSEDDEPQNGDDEPNLNDDHSHSP